MQPTTERVVAALNVLYGASPDPSAVTAANADLMAAQSLAGPAGWQLAHSLLLHEQPPVRFFGSRTLHTRVAGCASELSVPDRSALFDSCLSLLASHAGDDETVLRGIAESCALLAVVDAGLAVEEGVHLKVAQMVGSLDSQANCIAVCMVYEALPEQLHRSQLSNTARTLAKRELSKMAKSLISQSQFGAMLAGGLPLPAVRALVPWQSGGCFSLQVLHEHQLLRPLFSLILHPSTAEPAGTFLAGVLLDSEDLSAPLCACLECVSGLLEQLSGCLSQQDPAVSAACCAILLALGETHAARLLHNRTDRHHQAVFQLGLELIAVPSNSVFADSCGFWVELAEEVEELPEESLVGPIQELYTLLFRSILHRASTAMVVREELQEVRAEAKKVVRAVGDVFPVMVLETVLSLSGESCAQEVALWSLAAMADTAVCTMDHQLEQIFSSAFAPAGTPGCSTTHLQFIDAYSGWLCGTQLLSTHILPYLAHALRQLPGESAVLFEVICRTDPSVLLDQFGQLSLALQTVSSCEQQVLLVSGLAHVAATAESQRCLDLMQQLLEPAAATLQSTPIAQQHVDALQVFAAAVRPLKFDQEEHKPHPAVQLLSAVWPACEQALAELNCVAGVCGLVFATAEASAQQLGSQAPTLCVLLAAAFQRYGTGAVCCLDTITAVIRLSLTHADHQGVLQSFDAISKTAIPIIFRTVRNPEFLEAYLALCAQLVASQLVSPDVTQAAVKVAGHVLASSTELTSLVAAANLLESIWKSAGAVDDPVLSELMQQQGAGVICAMLNTLCNPALKSQLENLVLELCKAMRAMCVYNCHLAQNNCMLALQSSGHRWSLDQPAVKQYTSAIMKHARGSVSKLRGVLHDFRVNARCG